MIENHWKTKGYKSLNAYVNALIQADMEKVKEKNININNSNGVIVGDNGTINM